MKLSTLERMTPKCFKSLDVYSVHPEIYFSVAHGQDTTLVSVGLHSTSLYCLSVCWRGLAVLLVSGIRPTA